MTKRLIDVDDSDLEAARRVLGTDTIKDPVNSASAPACRPRSDDNAWTQRH
jgi:Arc/MetJ family transcription regulator